MHYRVRQIIFLQKTVLKFPPYYVRPVTHHSTASGRLTHHVCAGGSKLGDDALTQLVAGESKSVFCFCSWKRKQKLNPCFQTNAGRQKRAKWYGFGAPFFSDSPSRATCPRGHVTEGDEIFRENTYWEGFFFLFPFLSQGEKESF